VSVIVRGPRRAARLAVRVEPVERRHRALRMTRLVVPVA
jgi:hypothetical protein